MKIMIAANEIDLYDTESYPHNLEGLLRLDLGPCTPYHEG